jgi:hypothetical protein
MSTLITLITGNRVESILHLSDDGLYCDDSDQNQVAIKGLDSKLPKISLSIAHPTMSFSVAATCIGAKLP